MEEVIAKLRELMAQVAPTLNTDAGSPFDNVVVKYLREQFGIGELELDIEDMMIRRIQQLDPNISVGEGSAVHEFLIKVLPAIFQVPRLEVQRIKANQDFNNVDNMTDAEVDRRVSNFFITRRTGDVAVGTVRAYFANPVPVRTNVTNRAFAQDTGLGYYPDGAFEASQNLVAGNQRNGLYYVDIPYVAEAAGATYDLAAGSVLSIDNMPGLIRAEALTGFVGGVPRETSQALVSRAQRSIAERSLNSRNSIITILSERFPNQVMGVFPIGMGDAEMQRDVFTVYPSVGMDGLISQIISPAAGTGPFDLLHDDVDPASLKISVDGGAFLTTPAGYTFVQGTGGAVDKITLVAPAASVIVLFYWRLSKIAPLTALIPHSVETPPLFPSPTQEQEIHVGGKVDVYVKPSTEDSDSVTVENLKRFVVFKATDGNITLDIPSNRWYLTFSRGLTCGEVGALPGDVVEVVTQDAYGEPTVVPGNSFVIDYVDSALRKFRLASGPTSSVVDGDIRIVLREERALPLERLVAVDNLSSEIFLDTGGTLDDRATEYSKDVYLPLQPSMGFLNRDTSKPEFSQTFQTKLPMVFTRTSQVFDSRPSGDGVVVGQRYIDGGTTLGQINYAICEENIASGSLNTPWTRMSEVTLIDALSLQPLTNQTLKNIYPADIRSLDMSGGVDGDLSTAGRESAGKVRIYFEKPLVFMLYGDSRGEATRFVHRVEREVSPGVMATYNLVYKILSHMPAGQPHILVLPEDFTYDNGLYYVEAFVIGDHVASERSDAEPVTESELNLGDGALMYVGSIALADELYHRVDELEYEQAGEPRPNSLGGGAFDLEVPVDTQHPYLTFVGGWASDLFTITSGSNQPQMTSVQNHVDVGDTVTILIPSTVAFKPGKISGVSTPTVVIVAPDGLQYPGSLDLEAEGVQVGDYVAVTDTGGPTTTYHEITDITGDTMTVTPNLGGVPPYTLINVYKWTPVTSHRVLEVVSASVVRLGTPSTGSNKRFVISNQSGNFRLKSPYVRLGADPELDGTPGNESNLGIRAEGYWFDARDPYDRSLSSDQYTYSTREMTLWRYSSGADTRYLPETRPTASEIDLNAPAGSVVGKYRDNFTFMAGRRLSAVTATVEVSAGAGEPVVKAISGGANTVNIGTTDAEDCVDPLRLRVFIPSAPGVYYELQQNVANPPAAGNYYFQRAADDNDQDAIVIHNTDKAAALANGGGYALYLARVDYLVYLKIAQPSFATDNVAFQNGILAVFDATVSFKASDLATTVNNALSEVYAQVGKDDQSGNVVASTVIVDESGGESVTTAAGGAFTDAGADFVAAGVQPGDILLITGGAAPAGMYVIANLDLTAVDKFYVTQEFTTLSTAVRNYRIVRPYVNPTVAVNNLGDNFLSRSMDGKSIKLDYQWSSSVLAVHNYCINPSTRSVNQDLLVRHGIDIRANVKAVLNSNFADATDVKSSIEDYILALDQKPLYTSELIRLPTVAEHVPVPIDINGVALLENRRFATYRSLDGVYARRVEVIMPGSVEVSVNAL